MSKFPELFPGVRIGPQPDDGDLDELKRAGIKTVVDFRQPKETESSNEQLVQKHGLDYIGIPVDREDPSPKAVEAFQEAMRGASEPLLLHCGSGIRAITVYLLSKAKAKDWTPERVEQEITSRGFELSSHPPLRRLIKDYLA
ncbi:MAG: hypothetical protein CME36_16000 [unclassified Hahellaceae]|nr:hypothetical protein [Hahellaceae bacterium]|tara:strand:- start:41358 stop:41783 length:426 start_codon:yes stop_codon:yes gene_type:complete